MNGPKSKRKPAWRWELLPQDGRFSLMIFQIAQGERAFLAYSGVGDGEVASDVTNAAIARMAALCDKKVFMDLRKSLKPAERVMTAFDNAEDNSMVVFFSPDDSACAAVNRVIVKGRRMDPVV
jgi:hypothetical protein